MKRLILVSLLLIVFGTFAALSLSGSTNTVAVSQSNSGKEDCCKASSSSVSFCGDKGNCKIVCKKGNSDQGFLGVYLEDTGKGEDGVLITGIVDDSPAEEAGLEKGDIVIEAGGEKVEDYDDFEKMIESTGADNELMVKVLRDGKEKTFTATLDDDKESFVWSWSGDKFFPGKFKLGKGMHIFGGDDRGHIGVYVQDMNSQLEEYFKVENGVLITEVLEDRPGEQAGLEAGDVIISLTDKDVEDEEELFDILEDTEPGDKLNIGYVRNGKEKSLEVTLDNPYIPNYGYLGVKFEELNDQLKDYFDVKHGVLITEIIEESPAEKAGMKAGDVVIRFDGDKIKDNEDLVDAVHDGKPGDKVEITVIRDKKEMKFEAELERAKQKHWDLDIFGLDEDDHSQILRLDDMFELQDLEENLEDIEINIEIDDELDEIKMDMEDMKDELRTSVREVARQMTDLQINERIQDKTNQLLETIHENINQKQIQEQMERLRDELKAKIAERRLQETL